MTLEDIQQLPWLLWMSVTMVTLEETAITMVTVTMVKLEDTADTMVTLEESLQLPWLHWRTQLFPVTSFVGWLFLF